MSARSRVKRSTVRMARGVQRGGRRLAGCLAGCLAMGLLAAFALCMVLTLAASHAGVLP